MQVQKHSRLSHNTTPLFEKEIKKKKKAGLVMIERVLAYSPQISPFFRKNRRAVRFALNFIETNLAKLKLLKEGQVIKDSRSGISISKAPISKHSGRVSSLYLRVELAEREFFLKRAEVEFARKIIVDSKRLHDYLKRKGNMVAGMRVTIMQPHIIYMEEKTDAAYDLPSGKKVGKFCYSVTDFFKEGEAILLADLYQNRHFHSLRSTQKNVPSMPLNAILEIRNDLSGGMSGLDIDLHNTFYLPKTNELRLFDPAIPDTGPILKWWAR
ncbi:MAG: hypothetical protein WC308_02835 [archaeon]|jgi:hypothetical protein